MRIFILNPNPYDQRATIMATRGRQPLDLAYIASLLRADEQEITLLDAAILGLTAEETIKKIEQTQPDMLIATTSPIHRWECPMSYIDSIFRVIEGVKVKWKIITGTHGTTQPEWIWQKAPSTNIVVRGEPELTTQALVGAISHNEAWEDLPGISWRRSDGHFQHNPAAGRITDIDALPLPAYDLLPMDLYRYSFGDIPHPFSIVMTTRGCPYNCTFCCKVMLGREYILRQPEKVVEELRLLKEKYGVKGIFFQDFEFVINKKYVDHLCDLLIAANLGITWGCNARANDFYFRDLFIKMKQAGCVRINIGFESGSQKVLDTINKQVTTDQLEYAINVCRELGFKLGMYALLNAPGETKETIRETLEFLHRNKVKPMNFNLAIPYFGTEMYQQLINQVGAANAKYITWDNIETWAGKVNVELSPEQARRYQRWVKFQVYYGQLFFLNYKFYLYIWQNIWRQFRNRSRAILHS